MERALAKAAAANQFTFSTGPLSLALVPAQTFQGAVPFWLQEGFLPSESAFHCAWVTSVVPMKRPREMAAWKRFSPPSLQASLAGLPAV